jgi:hypothetical protein
VGKCRAKPFLIAGKKTRKNGDFFADFPFNQSIDVCFWDGLPRQFRAMAGDITRVCQIPLPRKWITDWQAPRQKASLQKFGLQEQILE